MVDGADGLKTGHTEQSGFGIVGSAVQDSVRRIVVVNGLSSEKERATESARLFRVALNDFTTKTLYKPGDIVGDAQVFKGKAASVPLIAKEPVTMIVHRSLANAVKATLVYEGPVAAPIAESQQIGYLRIETAGGSSREYPLYAGRAVRETGILGKIALGAKALLARPEASSAEAAQ
jgi:D-alanyl-D-alanine carboxypeptidase (penicillin-binding protein 5/6)